MMRHCLIETIKLVHATGLLLCRMFVCRHPLKESLMRWRRYHCPDLSIIFRLHFPAFEANKPNCTGSWRQVGRWCVKCQEGVVWKYISVVWKYIFVLENTPLRSGFARKPHFPIFLFAAREKVNTLSTGGVCGLLRFYNPISLLVCWIQWIWQIKIKDDLRRQLDESLLPPENNEIVWKEISYFFYWSILGTLSPVKNTKKMKIGAGMTAHGFDKISTFSRFSRYRRLLCQVGIIIWT